MISKLKIALSVAGIGTALGGGTCLALYWPQEIEETVNEEVEVVEKKQEIPLVISDEKKKELATKKKKLKDEIQRLKNDAYINCVYPSMWKQCGEARTKLGIKEKELKDLNI